MNIEYQLTKTYIYLYLENQQFCTYGIDAINRSTAKIQSQISDVSLDKSFVQQVIDLLNSAEVELCHFAEVVEDELNK